VYVLPAGTCGLAETARIAGYLAGPLAGQCGPCINGLPRLADTLVALTTGRTTRAEVERLAVWSPTVEPVVTRTAPLT
jgi:NADH:ubiquinone oxidoreductase subunit F (NADH-binding)